MINDSLFSTVFDKNIIAITLDNNQIFKHVTTATCNAFGYSSSEFYNKTFSDILVAKDKSINLFNKIPNDNFKMKFSKQDGEILNASVSISKDDEKQEYYLVLQDLLKEVISKEAAGFEMALNESENRKDFLHTIVNEQKFIMTVIHMGMLIDVNKAFLNFFNVPSLEHYLDNHGMCISETFEDVDGREYLQKDMYSQNWIEFVLEEHDEAHKVLIRGRIFDVSIVRVEEDGDEPLFIVTFSDITSLEKAQNYIEDSIEYASIIQHSLVPNNEVFRKYVDEFFVIWHPKDVVGGDIYLLEELRHDDEMMLFVIDCTGHGVPGAFVTMLVKAIERQVVGHILTLDDDEPVSPAQLLGVFNRSMKNLLKQESKDSISNAGFDGGFLYYNKKDNRLTYAGAKTPLFVMKGEELTVIEGDRHSIGYKRSKGNYSFTDHVIDLDEDTTVYLSTDGYMDQQGELNSMPFGKKKVMSLINQYSQEAMSDQQEIFLDEFMEHRGDRIANDDVTMVALKILSNKEGS